MSGIYAITKQDMSTGAFNWPAGDWSLVLTGHGYRPAFEFDEYLSDIPVDQQLSSPMALVGMEAQDGWCKANDVAFARLTTTDRIYGLVIVRTVDNQLVAQVDQGVGFGYAAVGGAAQIRWAPIGIFRP